MWRLVCLSAGLWAGVLVCIGAVAAPAAFSVLPSAEAGRMVGRLFEVEAYCSLALALVLLMLERRHSREAAGDGVTPAVTGNVLLLLGVLFCTVAGYFALLPMMQAARAGAGTVSFAALHAASGAFFVLKAGLVVALAWRLIPVKNVAQTS